MLLAPPAGDAYEFIIDLYTYPGAWINTFVAFGLIYLQYTPSENWTSPWKSYLPATVIFGLSNLCMCCCRNPPGSVMVLLTFAVVLVIVPFIPPIENTTSYPYYAFPLVGVAVLLFGGLYWVIWSKVWPRIRGYKVVAEQVFIGQDENGDGGQEVVRYRKVKVN